MSRRPEREWMDCVVLVGRRASMSGWSRGKGGGSVVLARDVGAGPPGVYAHDPTSQDGRGEWTQPTAWVDGVQSAAPDLVMGLVSHYGKRPHIPGRMGTRITYATVTAWGRQLPDIAAGVQAATASGLWRPPTVVLCLHTRTNNLDRSVRRAFEGSAVHWLAPDGMSPMKCAKALYGARSGRAAKRFK